MKPKALVLISGGIDSPVAAYLMSKRYNLTFLHLDNKPFTPDMTRKKVIKLVEKIRKIINQNSDLYIASHGPNLDKFMTVNRRFTCQLCKRMMYRIANSVANKIGAEAIITGDSLAQVASQTLSNMYTENKVSDIPIIRPLIGFDKEEIIQIAKKIGTYEISIQGEKGMPCCTAVPRKPATKSNVAEIEGLESELHINSLVKQSIKAMEKV